MVIQVADITPKNLNKRRYMSEENRNALMHQRACTIRLTYVVVYLSNSDLCLNFIGSILNTCTYFQRELTLWLWMYMIIGICCAASRYRHTNKILCMPPTICICNVIVKLALNLRWNNGMSALDEEEHIIFILKERNEVERLIFLSYRRKFGFIFTLCVDAYRVSF